MPGRALPSSHSISVRTTCIHALGLGVEVLALVQCDRLHAAGHRLHPVDEVMTLRQIFTEPSCRGRKRRAWREGIAMVPLRRVRVLICLEVAEAGRHALFGSPLSFEDDGREHLPVRLGQRRLHDPRGARGDGLSRR
jgi:hypothetical protein